MKRTYTRRIAIEMGLNSTSNDKEQTWIWLSDANW